MGVCLRGWAFTPQPCDPIELALKENLDKWPLKIFNKSYFFGLGGFRWDTLGTWCFNFVTEKKDNFQKN